MVIFSALELQLLPYPSFSGSTQLPLSSLSRLGCTSFYQHGQVSVSARLSDLSLVSVSSQSVVSTTNSSLIDVLWSSGTWHLAPLSAGVASVTATFDGQTNVLTISITDQPIEFTSISMAVNGVGPSSYTFSALPGVERAAAVQIIFEGGTRFDNVATINWVTLSAFITFESDDHSAISAAAATGVLTLNSNAAARTLLTARSLCDSTISSSLSVAANLLPVLGDVDLGQSQGMQFQLSGGTMQVPVHANAADGLLVNYQVEVVFDSSVFLAEGCTSGALDGFTCTLNDPTDQVKLIATDTASTSSGSNVLLGTFTLRVQPQASGVTLLSGTIVELVRNTPAEVRTSNIALVAGQGYADVSSGGRLLSQVAVTPGVLSNVKLRSARRRQLATA